MPRPGRVRGPGACDALSGQCVYAAPAEGTACDDGLWCTVSDQCHAGACEPGAARDCTASAAACQSAACDEAGDQCATSPFPAGTPCGGGASCVDGVLLSADSCDGHGQCVGSQGVSCAPYAGCVDDAACASTCEIDDDCVDGALCVEHACQTNQRPVADAGDDTVVLGNHEVQLDGTGSSDPDGDALTYAWSVVSGPGGAFDDNAAATPTFLAPAVQAESQAVLQLVVNDGLVDSEPDTLIVTIQPLQDLPDVHDDAADGADGSGDDADHEAGQDSAASDAAVDPQGPDAPAADAPAPDTVADDPDHGQGGGSSCAASGTPHPGMLGLLGALLALASVLRRRRTL